MGCNDIYGLIVLKCLCTEFPQQPKEQAKLNSGVELSKFKAIIIHSNSNCAIGNVLHLEDLWLLYSLLVAMIKNVEKEKKGEKEWTYTRHIIFRL